jgi:serine/threonine protein kinase
MEEPLQKSLERYDVLDRIAVGGMAEVFLAKAYGAHGFEKTLAIKRILPELASDPEFAARFIAEAKVAVRLSHANVVQVFDFGRIGESLFIAMEYVDGLDLAALLKKYKDEGRHVPLPAALHIAIEIIRGLDFAHQHNVVHRDVSPSNILISRAGEVKLGDFGIAVAASPHRVNRGTGPRKVMGKWRYMSPEQARGDTLDTRSDLFSAASVMFELFTGQKLFPGDEAEDIIKNIENMPIPKTSSLRPGLPSRLDDILAGPLARKPIDRPARPATVLRQLIELSYESSIMATALDVSEAVASVLPAKRISGPGQQLDDVIRKQLGAAERERSVARRTAVTDGKPPSTETMDRLDHSTGMIRRLDIDGISRLEEVDPVDPTAVAAPRAKRLSESGSVKAIQSPDSAMHELLDAKFDPDRRTEVGGPPAPTAPVPKAEATSAAPKSVTQTHTQTGSPSRAGIWIVVVLVMLGIGGFTAWRFLVKPTDTEVVTPSVRKDASIEVQMGFVEIDPSPRGAMAYIEDMNGVIAAEFKTPGRRKVEAGKPFRVRLELEGYEPYIVEKSIEANQTLLIAQPLQKAKARLEVTTTPEGAQVSLKGRLLGETPLVRNDLEAAKGELVVSKAGFEPYREKVELVAGKTVQITQTLKAAAKYGTIKLTFKGNGWGDVYYKGTKLGRAPGYIKAPIGRTKLHLVNTGRTPSIEWDVSCDVSESVQLECKTQLP